MQGDGNFMLYEVHGGRNIAVWASNTSGSGGVRAVMQTDGNLVIYTSVGTAVWSKTTGSPGATLVMQDDGNLVIYDAGGHPLWASDTWRHFRKLQFHPFGDGFKFRNHFVNAVATIPGYGPVTTKRPVRGHGLRGT
jgi:hypothetical protein